MRLPVEGLKTGFVRVASASIVAVGLVAWATAGQAGTADRQPTTERPLTGPQADYPVVVGAPYAVGDVTYRPVDVMNYDAVGYLAADVSGNGISGSHHTLPLPSYVEVTSLETGHTILVRIERRGPMASQDLIALSDGALEQLGAAPGTPVRVRRVNPQEFERARLRAGETVSVRMDTPMSLVEILKRKLPSRDPAGQPELAAAPEGAQPRPPSPEPPVPAEASPPVANSTAAFVVQAATFSNSGHAANAARDLGGKVSPAGKYFLVRTGPFATRGEAEASLAKVRGAGYRDARIYTSG